MPNSFGQKVFDTTGSVYGVTASPSYYSSGLNGDAKTLGAALSTNPTDSQASVNAVNLFPALNGTVFGQPVTHWFLLLGITVLVYWALHHHGGIEKDVATPRIGLGSFWSIGIQAVLFVFLFKAILTKYHIPGLSELFASV